MTPEIGASAAAARRRSCGHGLVLAASSSEPPASVGLACRLVGAWRRHLVKQTHYKADGRHIRGPPTPAFQHSLNRWRGCTYLRTRPTCATLLFGSAADGGLVEQ